MIPVISDYEHLTIGWVGLEKRMISDVRIDNRSDWDDLNVFQADQSYVSVFGEPREIKKVHADVLKSFQNPTVENNDLVRIGNTKVRAYDIRSYFASVIGVAYPSLSVYYHGSKKPFRQTGTEREIRLLYCTMLSDLHKLPLGKVQRVMNFRTSVQKYGELS